MKLPWETSSYVKLEPGDLAPTPAPTPEQRIRVAAALATVLRDARMTGEETPVNGETIRGVLVEDAAAWARDIGSVARVLDAYDATDPLERFEQIKRQYY